MSVNQRKVGVIISYLGQIVHILTGLVYTPIMLRLLGQNEYGLYQLVFSVVSYLSLLSLGFGTSYMRFYAREKAKRDDEGVAKLNGMFMLIFIIISLVCILCGIILVINVHSIFGEGLEESEYGIAIILLIIMVISLSLTFPNSVFNCIITSQERFLFQKTLILVQYIANPLLTLPLLLLGYGSIGMVAASTFLTICVLATNAYYCFAKLKTKFIFKDLQFSLLKEMAIFTSFIFLNQIIDQINWSVDKYLLGRLAGTIAVAVYGVGSQINTLYLQLSTSVSNVFVPQVNKIIAEIDNDKELTSIFIKVGRAQFMVLMLIVTGFIFFGTTFISIWAGAGYESSYYVTLFLIIPVTVPLIQNIGIEIQMAKNKHKTRSLVYFFISIANIIISVPLIKSFGPTGAAIGTAVSLTVGNILFMNWYYHKKMGIDIPLFWKSMISFIPTIIISCAFGFTCIKFFSIKSIWELLLFGILYCLVYCLSLYSLSMQDQERRWVTEPVSKRQSNASGLN